MPTLVRAGGFAVRMYTRDHAPPHVHVIKAGAVVRVDLSSCSATLIVGRIGDRDVKRAELLVAENQRYLNDQWERLHDSRQTDAGGS